MIGLGIVTCQREGYYQQVVGSIAEHLDGNGLRLYAYQDGGSPYVFNVPPWEGGVTLHHSIHNRGVAVAKNWLLNEMFRDGCAWLAIIEDDILVRSSKAISGYIEAAEKSGIGHLCFHGHGTANVGPDRGADDTGLVTYWPNWIGAFCLYSRQSIEEVGLLDEDFGSALDHVEHSVRLAKAGFCPLPSEPGVARVADATGSEEWLEEILGSIENSVIVNGDPAAAAERFRQSRELWRQKDPAGYRLVFGGR